MPPILPRVSDKADATISEGPTFPLLSIRNVASLVEARHPRRDSEAEDWDAFLDSTKMNPNAYNKRELGHRFSHFNSYNHFS